MAPLDYQTASVKLGEGVNTKTDPKAVQGKLLTLSNGIFTAPNQIAKRNGYDVIARSLIGNSSSSFTSPVMVKSYKSSLLAAAGDVLYDYSTSLTQWKNAGKYDSILTTNTTISAINSVNFNTQMVISGNYAVVTFESSTTATTYGDLYASLVDLTTNTIVSTSLVRLSSTQSKLFLFPDGKMVVVYVCGGNITLNQLQIVTSGTSGLIISNVGGGTTIASDPKLYNTSGTKTFYSYDIAVSGNNMALFYSGTAAGTPLNIKTFNSTGSQQATTSVANLGLALPIQVVLDSSNNFWVYWGAQAAVDHTPNLSSSLRYLILSSGFGITLASTQIAAAGGVSDYVRQITARPISTTNQDVFWSTGTNQSGSSTVNLVTPTIRTKNVTSAGVISTSTSYVFGTPISAANIEIFGKMFTYNSKNYLPVVFYSQDQFTGLVLDLSDGHVAAKFLVGTAEAAHYTEVNSDFSTGGYWWRSPGNVTVPQAYGSNSILFGAGKVIGTTLGTTTGFPHFDMCSVIVTLAWNSQDSFQAIECNGSVVLNGSVPLLYDGNTTSELGFNYFPEVNAVAVTSGGSMADGTYGYQFVYQYTDANGNLYQSAPSDLVSVVLSGGSGSGSINLFYKDYIGGLHPTNSVLVYRTSSGGSIPYLIGYAVATDTGITANQSQPIYTNGGAILNNSAPPCSMVMWINNSRIWMVNSETQEIWYSKTFSTLGGIQMSDSLLIAPDLRFGNITGGIAMDEKTILGKDNGFTYFVGDGANDSGQGSSLTLPQPIPSDVGCSGSKGIILYPGGVIFRASNSKGIYMLSRGTQIQYIGMDVESYNSQSIQAAEMIPNKSQIRFLTSSGSSLVYDYIMNQWSTFSNHLGYSSCIWNGTYVYARTDGSIYKENSTTFLDNATAYTLGGTTAWLKASSTQNFQRVREIEWLGDFQGAGGHGIQIAVATDFSSTTTNLAPMLFTGSNAPFQFRGFPPQQKCDALQLTFTEITTGASGEFIDLTDLGLVIGLKKGLNKLAASKSVG